MNEPESHLMAQAKFVKSRERHGYVTTGRHLIKQVDFSSPHTGRMALLAKTPGPIPGLN
jgi:hypothetical protein